MHASPPGELEEFFAVQAARYEHGIQEGINLILLGKGNNWSIDMTTVIDLFWMVVEDAKENSSPMDPIKSISHPLNSITHPLRSITHPLASITHPLNSIMTQNRGVRRVHALKRLLDEYFPEH